MTALDTRIPPGLDADGMSLDERRHFEALRANRAMGLLMQRVPVDFAIWEWVIRNQEIQIMPRGADSDHAKRATIMALAEQFGFEYTETRHGSTGQNYIAAKGVYHDTPVSFWQLVNACNCGCGVA